MNSDTIASHAHAFSEGLLVCNKVSNSDIVGGEESSEGASAVADGKVSAVGDVGGALSAVVLLVNVTRNLVAMRLTTARTAVPQ